jgi:hypothetical protein
MKAIYTFCIIAFSVSILTGQNLMRNGGFENPDNFEFWDSTVTVTGASVGPVNTQAHSGSWSVEIKSGTSPVGGWTQLMQTLLTPLNNINYRLTFWIKDSVTASNFMGVYGLTASDEIALGIDSLNNTATTISDSGRMTITQNFFQNWGRLFYYFNSGQDYTGYLFKFEEATSGNTLTVYLDDLGILPLPGQATIQLTSPNGGENWSVNSQENITWTSENITDVKIDYSTNNGALWLNVVSSVPAGSGSYSWTIPNTPSEECLVRISDAGVASRFDVSDSTFTIAPLVTLIAPNGGEQWISGEQQNITWVSQNITNVGLDFSDDNGSNWTNIIASTPASTGSYSWTIPNISSTQCLVRISDASDPLSNDVSDATFSILNPTVTVLTPNGGEHWTIGSFRQITWNSTDITNVKIEYSTDNGTAWLIVTASRPAGNGTHNWIIPNAPSTQCLVRISDVSNPAINDISDNTFTIEEPVSVKNLDSGIPDHYELFQNYPNPFNPSTAINFSLPEETNVTLKIYNTLGEKIADLFVGRLYAGFYSYHWNALNFESGIYIYELRTDNFVSVKKMALLK